jgi:hypothetical protein
MCLITCHLKGSPPMTADELTSAWEDNPHGAGFMYVSAGKLIIRKPFWTLDDLKAAYYADHAKYGGDSAFVLHLRWATHGEQDELNTHPHLIPCSDGVSVGLVHNGILPVLPPKESGISDTVFFCRTVLAGRPSGQILAADYGKELGGMIGGNKLVLLSDAGELMIVNVDKGAWDGQTWYSNLYWRETAAEYDPLFHFGPADCRRGTVGERPGVSDFWNPPSWTEYMTDDEELDDLRRQTGVDFANWGEVEDYYNLRDDPQWEGERERLEIEAAFDRLIA